jgi:hypothetical protein
MPVFDQFETVQEHAARFKKTPRTIRGWMNERDGLPHTFVGRTPYLKPSWTIAWMESRRRVKNPITPKRRRAA